MYITNEPLPSKEEVEKRNNIMKELLDSKIVERAIEEVKKFFKEKGLESASINIQIFPEFCQDGHKECRSLLFPKERGNFYLYNTKYQ